MTASFHLSKIVVILDLMESILILLKKIIPHQLFRALQPFYHRLLNWLAAVWYHHPSEEMIVIGVTGTTGKTTVVYMIAQMLQNAGKTVGYTSTAMFGDGKKEWLNDKKMTMLGRFFTQRMLRNMVDNGCEYAIVETTSEGAVQFRHRYINYDLFLITGLYPEHIDSHGSFENYKAAKLSLFAHLASCSQKKITRQSEGPTKNIVVHGDDEHAVDFLAFDGVGKYVFAHSDAQIAHLAGDKMYYKYMETTSRGVRFQLEGEDIQLQLLGDFTATNACAAAVVGKVLGLSFSDIGSGLEGIEGIPGRLERIHCGQDFEVIVDYAFEPVAVEKLYETVTHLSPERIIHVLGSTGGGRDVARRGALGAIAGHKASVVIVTNEDPYDDDPMEIMQSVARGARDAGKSDDRDLYVIEDRRDAIEKALGLAQAGDVVLITGKGCEQAIAVADGKKIPWDDRVIVREVLQS